MNLANHKSYQDIKELLQQARSKIYHTINTTMTQTYCEIGKKIVQEEQGGATRAEYGQRLIENLSVELTSEFGSGFSVRNLMNMRRFYVSYEKSQTVSAKFVH